MARTYTSMVKASERRKAELEEPYDPFTGEGSFIERVPIVWGRRTVHLPRVLAQEVDVMRAAVEEGDLRRYWEKQGRRQVRNWRVFQKRMLDERFKYDFEFWMSECCTIKLDAETRAEKGDVHGTLVLNRAQRIYAQLLHERFFAGEPIRIILLKARQWGGSTLTQMFMAWVQVHWRRGWNIFVANLTLAQAAHIRQMYETMVQEYPSGAPPDPFSIRGYQGQRNHRYLPELDSIIGITSIERPDSPRSFSIHMAHLSEVGLWPSTESVNAEDYAEAITGAVAEEPHTLIVEESTAKGVGTYFHNHWLQATKDPPETSYVPVFIAWHDIPKYMLDLPEDLDAVRFIRSWDDYERQLWERGCCMEQIYWYRRKLKDFKGNRTKMQSEFPTTAQEAFQSTGHRFFAAEHVEQLRKAVREPAARGTLRAREEEGTRAFDDIRFVRQENGPLQVWLFPGETSVPQLVDTDLVWSGRYCGFADFGGKRETADWSVLTILDRAPMARGGAPEVAARLRMHCRPDRFAWLCARVCAWYDYALLGFEINRHRQASGDDIRGYEPEWSFAVLEQIRDHYGNLYMREDPEHPGSREHMKLGFHMNSLTKPMLLNQLDAAIEDGLYVERDETALHELDLFEQRVDGTLGAVEGNHDDVVISTAGTVWLALSQMPPVSAREPQRRRSSSTPHAAQF